MPRALVAGRQNRTRLEVQAMTHPGDEEIADRLTREQAAQDAIRARIAAQTQRAQEAEKGRSAGERRG
ncbi:hypothetical protein [Asaia krungthepensis]|nr:hypothetical protein [Asaia krungthepensis]